MAFLIKTLNKGGREGNILNLITKLPHLWETYLTMEDLPPKIRNVARRAALVSLIQH